MTNSNKAYDKLKANNDVLLEACKKAQQIVGKVIADNLMPDIVMPNFPKHVEELLEKAIKQAEQA